ncbi:Tau-tubulin kinase 1 [Trichinella pseudospiralis]|uniref:non-specific serine/threonine protein kinase n=2 Tax=Trichinella pseudospiralis TaxID=6337 RepID=A0A0V1FFP6_TRIPS|nr:Tau-tubulin kinase 1 [Trichinella pseudospiralis]KRY74619.1 Tau-tubulin kinase 1 [Trichinella pseudospiralis]KRY84796.1 Tau-tubulin kinase 1 [Trichinella pseudospiralis]KRZ16248.1 Tau-tubulin kinase 1 [Trichinella pseudospiralis]KRZ39830.1 Tau-tubulin kinase 1 [Trichinella pseudospiralis]
MDSDQIARIKPGSVLFNRFEVIRKLGAGSFGAVFEVIDGERGSRVAIKLEIKKNGGDEKGETFFKEVEILEAMQGVDHFLQYFGQGKHRNCHYIIMEAASKSVASLLQHSPRGKFSLSTSAYFAYNFVEALKEFHKAGFLHRDVKPGNFIIKRIEDTLNIYLIDFGSVKPIENYCGTSQSQNPVPFVGTLNYASPNVHRGRPYGCIDDMFSVFYSFLKINTGTLPWSGHLKKALVEKKVYIQSAELIGCKPRSVYQIYDKLCSLTCDDVIDYEWFIDKFKSLITSDQSPLSEIFECLAD